MSLDINLGAVYLGNERTRFCVWAPYAGTVDVHIVSPKDRVIPLARDERAYYSAVVDGVGPGSLYFLRLDGDKERPDPASRFQPGDVHGPSQVVDREFPWSDGNRPGIPLREYIIYEVHVGTFTPEGTFDAMIPRLPALRDLGINNIEIMPVSQFPGGRNWGYDGVYPFAVQNTYGGPQGFKKLIDACHREGLAVTLDVVYNHFGPEGNYLREFGPYFTGKYNTLWGEALNFDDAYNDEVRNYFLQNAIYWLKEFHIDALRLDAVHAIYDLSAVPFLRELGERVEELSKESGRKRYLIAESDLNDSRLIRPRSVWGYGLDAQWSDDFHHSLHVLLTGEQGGYYVDFGRVEHMVKALNEGFVYAWDYSPFRKRRHGNFAADIPPERHVVALQNHDQVGNRMLGERISTLIPFEAQKLGNGVVLLSPYIPLIFMGQEYGEEAPFLYFVSHTDPDLVAAVRKGRSEEFKDFAWEEEPPDPESEDTFNRSRIHWDERNEGRHGKLLEFFRTLVSLRREIPAFAAVERDSTKAQGFEDKKLVVMKQWAQGCEVLCFFNFNSEDVSIEPGEIHLDEQWRSILDSSDEKWGGPGALMPAELKPDESLTMRAHSLAVYIRESNMCRQCAPIPRGRKHP